MWERNELTALNKLDSAGNPSGGWVKGKGLHVDWQDGPLGRPPDGPAEPNGTFVDDVIEAARQRL